MDPENKIKLRKPALLFAIIFIAMIGVSAFILMYSPETEEPFEVTAAERPESEKQIPLVTEEMEAQPEARHPTDLHQNLALSYLLIQDLTDTINMEYPFQVSLHLLDKAVSNKEMASLIAQLKPYAQTGVLSIDSLDRLLISLEDEGETEPKADNNDPTAGVIGFFKKTFQKYIMIQREDDIASTSGDPLTWDTLSAMIDRLKPLSKDSEAVHNWIQQAQAAERVFGLLNELRSCIETLILEDQ